MPPSPSVSIAALEEPPPLPPAPSQPPRTGAPIRPSEKVTDFAVSSLSLPSFAFSLLSARFCAFAVFRFSLRRHVAEDPHELLGGVNAVEPPAFSASLAAAASDARSAAGQYQMLRWCLTLEKNFQRLQCNARLRAHPSAHPKRSTRACCTNAQQKRHRTQDERRR